MDNILYIGPYREFSGMGNAARQYIKALIKTGHNISIRPIYNLFKPYPITEIDNDILELESNFSKTYHKVIQHCYPHQLTFDRRFEKNIAIVHLESFGYKSLISEYTNIMDMIVVGSNFVYKSLVQSGSDPQKIRIIPEPIDLEVVNLYKQNNKQEDRKAFSFYTICDFVDRKNLDKIITAYGLAYDIDDNVELIIKLKNFSNTDIHINETVDYTLGKIYTTLRRNHIKKPKIILGNTKHDAIMYLHHNNDCFINASSGESFGYATLEAMAFNNNVIVNDKIGSSEILAEHCGLLTETKTIGCVDSDRIYYQYNTIDNNWYEPQLESLIENMYKASNETPSLKQRRIDSQNSQLNKFSTDTISQYFVNI